VCVSVYLFDFGCRMWGSFSVFFLGIVQIGATYNREIHVNVLLVYLQEYDKSNNKRN